MGCSRIKHRLGSERQGPCMMTMLSLHDQLLLMSLKYDVQIVLAAPLHCGFVPFISTAKFPRETDAHLYYRKIR